MLQKQQTLTIGAIIFAIVMAFFSFANASTFWYFYAFTMLMLMALTTLTTTVDDEQPNWRFVFLGIGYGALTYVLAFAGFFILELVDAHALLQKIEIFFETYGPNNIWHYLLLVFIIIIGEELFWRGFVQKQLQQKLTMPQAVLFSALLFSLTVLVSGFWIGAVAAFLCATLWGFLYEWQKSMPLVIVTHLTFSLMLFLVLPL